MKESKVRQNRLENLPVKPAAESYAFSYQPPREFYIEHDKRFPLMSFWRGDYNTR